MAPTHTEILALSLSSQSFAPSGSQDRHPSAFLTLAPTTSASYPTNPVAKSTASVPSSEQSSIASETAVGAEGEAIPVEVKTRRSSSLSSNGSLQKKRFLKLGPVHHGESNGDWSDEVVSE